MIQKTIQLAAVLGLLALAACATGPSYYANQPPVDTSPQAIMAQGTCSELPLDKTGTANAGGWVVKAPPGMSPVVSCGGRYASGAFYCADPSKCGELTWTSTPTDPDDRGKVWHAIVDLVSPGATVTVCAEPAYRFGIRGRLDCAPVPLTMGDKGARGAFPVTVPPLITSPGEGTVQTSPTVMISIMPSGTKPITIGQIGWAERGTGQ